MTKTYSPERFQELFREFTERENTILAWKAGEYSSGNDRLQNFREIAAGHGCRPQDVALMYLLKHIQSISLAVRENRYEWEWEKEGGEGMKQRVADSRNYLLLLAACMDEESEQDIKYGAQ